VTYRRAEVLGVPVDAVSERQILDFVKRRIDEAAPARVVTVNAEFVMLARRDPHFAAVLRSADLATPDGAGVVWAMRRKGVVVPERVGGADLIWSVPALAAREGQSVFFLGGAEGVAASAAQRLRERYPRLRVAGTYSGFSEPGEEAHIVDLVRRSGAQILFVAFGAPAQDLWIARNLSATGAMIGLGVGGSFDYVAGTARRAPVWMRRQGLDWLWRLIRQPWRWRRMLALPRFAWLVWRHETVHRTGERIEM